MTAWRAAARQYVVRHEQMLLDAVDDGFGEGGGGYIWTFSGCLLFAVSLLTTLGFGAPVPRTTGGRAAAAVFAAVGIPLHLLLALNAGALFAAHLTRLALRLEARRLRLRLAPAPATASPAPGGRCCASPRWPCGDACWLPAPWAVACAPAAWPCSRRRGECAPAPGPVPARGPLPAVAPTDAGDKIPPLALDAQLALEAGEAKGAWAAEEAAAAEAPGPPAWLRWLPVSAAFLYYLVGLVAFGAARGRPFAACLLFPLDFTATGGVGRVAGALRAVYALYLEGAVLLAFTGVALHRADAARGLTALGLRWRLIVADHV